MLKLLMVVIIKIIVFWDVKLCTTVDHGENSVLFYLKDGDSKFLQNNGNNLPDYMVSHPRRQ
jgi:hypothetical protein